MNNSKDIILMVLGFALAILAALWFCIEHRTYYHAPAVSALSLDEEAARIERSYTEAADEHTLIASSGSNAYYCKIRYVYEGPNNCGVFLEKSGTYTYTGLTATDPDTTLLLSPDKEHIVVLDTVTASLITVSDASSKVIYSAPEHTNLGVFGSNSDFKGRARWIDNSHLEVKVYADDANNDADTNDVTGRGATESKPIKTEIIKI